MNASVLTLSHEEAVFSQQIERACAREDIHTQADIVHAVERAGRHMFGGQAHVIIAGSVMKKTVCFDSDLDLVLATPTITGTEAERRTLANYLLEEAVFKDAILEIKYHAISIHTATNYSVDIVCQDATFGRKQVPHPENPFKGKQQAQDAVKYLKIFQRTKCRQALPGLMMETWVLDDLKASSEPHCSALSLVLSIFNKAKDGTLPVPRQGEPGARGARAFIHAATEALAKIRSGQSRQKILLTEVGL